jgi:branched-chain amino acid transport system ATP-binding protein
VSEPRTAQTARATLLEVDALRAGYGNIEVLHDVSIAHSVLSSIALEESTLCAIVGANGAGKTTLLMTLAGEADVAAACSPG